MGKWNTWHSAIAQYLDFAWSSIHFTKYAILTELAEVSLAITWGISCSMKELPAEGCFLWSLAQTVLGCLFSLDVQNRSIIFHKCFHYSWPEWFNTWGEYGALLLTDTLFSATWGLCARKNSKNFLYGLTVVFLICSQHDFIFPHLSMHPYEHRERGRISDL